ncbi:MAG: hypothetical protein ACXVZ4_13355 [Gaiellaceae bacterium]
MTGSVPLLAADGATVAFSVSRRLPAPNYHEELVETWTPGSRAATVVARDLGDPYETDALVLAGRRVVWVSGVAGDGLEQTLLSAQPGRRPVEVGSDLFYNNEGGMRGGTFVGELHGAGDLVALNTWSGCNEYDMGSGQRDPTCVPSDPSWLYDGKLRVLTRTGYRVVATGLDAMRVVDVDANRIVLRHGNRAVSVVDKGGKRLARYDLAPGTVQGAALDGDQLVILTPTDLAVFRPPGSREERCALPPAPRTLVDARGGLAVVIERSRVLRVVRLGDCRELRLAPRSGSFSGAALTGAGLWYAVNRRGTGRLAFVSRARLLAAFG